MDIDVNEIGRQSYKLLRDSKVIPDKDKTDLTFKERDEIVNLLYDKLETSISKSKIKDNAHKYEFLSYVYLSVILYLDNTDLNKFIKISTKSLNPSN